MRARYLIPLLALAALLGACSLPPVTVPIENVDVRLANTAEQVALVKIAHDPLPAGHLVGVKVYGEASFDSAQNVTLTFYATTDVSGCSVSGDYAVCPENAATQVSDTLTFNNEAGPKKFALDKNTAVLAEGLNRGKLYLGAKVGGAALGQVLHLKNMYAVVQVQIP